MIQDPVHVVPTGASEPLHSLRFYPSQTRAEEVPKFQLLPRSPDNSCSPWAPLLNCRNPCNYYTPKPSDSGGLGPSFHTSTGTRTTEPPRRIVNMDKDPKRGGRPHPPAQGGWKRSAGEHGDQTSAKVRSFVFLLFCDVGGGGGVPYWSPLQKGSYYLGGLYFAVPYVRKPTYLVLELGRRLSTSCHLIDMLRLFGAAFDG